MEKYGQVRTTHVILREVKNCLKKTSISLGLQGFFFTECVRHAMQLIIILLAPLHHVLICLHYHNWHSSSLVFYEMLLVLILFSKFVFVDFFRFRFRFRFIMTLRFSYFKYSLGSKNTVQ